MGGDEVSSKPAFQKTAGAKAAHPLKKQIPKSAAPSFVQAACVFAIRLELSLFRLR